jgi:hypothetical protein
VCEDILELLGECYGKEAPLTITRGKVHKYLGMTIDYSIEGKVKISMKKYIDEVLDEAPDNMDGETATPAANHLFTVSNQPDPLDEAESSSFTILQPICCSW